MRMVSTKKPGATEGPSAVVVANPRAQSLLGRVVARGFDNAKWSDRVLCIFIERPVVTVVDDTSLTAAAAAATTGVADQPDDRTETKNEKILVGDDDAAPAAAVVASRSSDAETATTVADGCRGGGDDDAKRQRPAVSSTAAPTAAAKKRKEASGDTVEPLVDGDDATPDPPSKRSKSAADGAPTVCDAARSEDRRDEKAEEEEGKWHPSVVWRRLHVSTAVVASNSVVLEKMLTNGMLETDGREVFVHMRDKAQARAFVAMIRCMYDTAALDSVGAPAADLGSRAPVAATGDGDRGAAADERKNGSANGDADHDASVVSGAPKSIGGLGDGDSGELECRQLLDILMICDVYQYAHGIAACAERLARPGCLDVDTCCVLLSWSDASHPRSHLLDACPSLLTTASTVLLTPWKLFDQVWCNGTRENTKKWRLLSFEAVVSILSNDGLDVWSENTVFQAARDWWCQNCVAISKRIEAVPSADVKSLAQHAESLVRCVRMPFCTPAFLVDVVGGSFTFDECRPAMAKIYRSALEYASVRGRVRSAFAMKRLSQAPRASYRPARTQVFEWLSPNLTERLALRSHATDRDAIDPTEGRRVTKSIWCGGYLFNILLVQHFYLPAETASWSDGARAAAAPAAADSATERDPEEKAPSSESDLKECATASPLQRRATLALWLELDVEHTRDALAKSGRPIAVPVKVTIDAMRPTGRVDPESDEKTLRLIDFTHDYVEGGGVDGEKAGVMDAFDRSLAAAIDPVTNEWLTVDTAQLRLRIEIGVLADLVGASKTT